MQNKLKKNYIRRIPAIIQPRILCRSLYYLNINIKTCRTIILLDVSYGCETWSLTQFEDIQEQGAGNIFRIKMAPVRVCCRKSRKEKVHSLPFITYYMGDNSSMTRWTGDMARMEEYINACRVFLGKSLWKRLQVSSECR